ncbi:MAG TPA: hypothetical protein VFX97_02415 [Pyrinomonadaceae bacterium]|nr:hypothetical protein [Pyrinomonadaceae bacterium]
MRTTFAKTFSVLFVAFASPLLSCEVFAQPLVPQLPTPPPMRFVARDDRSQLTTTRDAKGRVKLSIELAAARLTQIEAFTSQKEFEKASEALGTYLGLIEDAMRFIGAMPREKSSTRDLYRRLDIALRAQIPRLAVMRRDTPSDYAIHLKTAEEFTRNTRTEALESFYGNTVLREDPEKKADANKVTPQDNKRP